MAISGLDHPPTDLLVLASRLKVLAEPKRLRILQMLMEGVQCNCELGARTAWHAHPLGQTLIITAGCGRVQRWDGPIENVHPGDVVQFAPGEKHWHGAAPTTAMSHIAIQENYENSAADWMERVSDEQYQE